MYHFSLLNMTLRITWFWSSSEALPTQAWVDI